MKEVAIAIQMGQCPNQPEFPGTVSTCGIEFAATPKNLVRCFPQNGAEAQDASYVPELQTNICWESLWRMSNTWQSLRNFSSSLFTRKVEKNRPKDTLIIECNITQ